MGNINKMYFILFSGLKIVLKTTLQITYYEFANSKNVKLFAAEQNSHKTFTSQNEGIKVG